MFCSPTNIIWRGCAALCSTYVLWLLSLLHHLFLLHNYNQFLQNRLNDVYNELRFKVTIQNAISVLRNATTYTCATVLYNFRFKVLEQGF